MILQEGQLVILSQIAKNAALKASEVIADAAQRDIKVERKAFGESLASQVVTEVDRLAQEIIISELHKSIIDYDLGLLAEESDDNGSRLVKDYFWCIDPIDGTLCFTRKRPGYSVSIGLISKEGISQLGVIADPFNQNLYHAIKGSGVWKNDQKLSRMQDSQPGGKVTLVCDEGFIKSPGFADWFDSFGERIALSGYTSVEVMEGGGAVMSAMYVLENTPACYFKLPKERIGGGSFWDYAASNCIFNELGATASDFQKEPLMLNNPASIYMNNNGVVFSTNERLRDILVELWSQKSKK